MTPQQPDNDERPRLAADKALYQAKKMGRNRIVRACCDNAVEQASVG